MSNNPLQHYFRRPALWVKLPSSGKWYKNGEVSFNEQQEIQVYGITAVDEIMLNTPDALFNGHALETVITSCVPEVHDVKSILQPDLEAMFVGIKSASNGGKFEINRSCEKCKHENVFELQCDYLLDNMTFIEDSDCVVNVNDELNVFIKPYDFVMRSMLIRRQLEERKTLQDIADDASVNNNLVRADLYARSIETMTKLTFRLVADSITAIEILKPTKIRVTDKEHIAEWLTSVNKNTTDSIMSAVTVLNETGPMKSIPASCQNCDHTWTEYLNLDPALFFYQ